MKRGCPSHPKVADLAARLNVPRYSAVGILEMLWHFTAQYALSGDIGRFTDESIAAALCYDGDSSILVQCLVDSKWIDRCACHRLRIHDWKDHADQTVERVLAKRNQVFISCYDDPSTVLVPSKMPLPLPNPKANSLKPKAKPIPPAALEGFEEFWKAYPRKKARASAEKAWLKVNRPPTEELLKAIENQKQSQDWIKDGGQYIPHPTTWLNQGRWTDEVTTPNLPPQQQTFVTGEITNI